MEAASGASGCCSNSRRPENSPAVARHRSLPDPIVTLASGDAVGVRAAGGSGNVIKGSEYVQGPLELEVAQPVQDHLWAIAFNEYGVRHSRRRARLDPDGAIGRDPGEAVVRAQFEEDVEETADAK